MRLLVLNFKVLMGVEIQVEVSRDLIEISAVDLKTRTIGDHGRL